MDGPGLGQVSVSAAHLFTIPSSLYSEQNTLRCMCGVPKVKVTLYSAQHNEILKERGITKELGGFEPLKE